MLKESWATGGKWDHQPVFLGPHLIMTLLATLHIQNPTMVTCELYFHLAVESYRNQSNPWDGSRGVGLNDIMGMT